MSDDWGNATLMHLGKPIVHLRGDTEVAELDQQVMAFADTEFFGRAQCGLHVVKGKMEVAAEA